METFKFKSNTPSFHSHLGIPEVSTGIEVFEVGNHIVVSPLGINETHTGAYFEIPKEDIDGAIEMLSGVVYKSPKPISFRKMFLSACRYIIDGIKEWPEDKWISVGDLVDLHIGIENGVKFAYAYPVEDVNTKTFFEISLIDNKDCDIIEA